MQSFVNERDRYKLNLFAKAASTTMKNWFWYDLRGRHEEFLGGGGPGELRNHRVLNEFAAKHHHVGAEYRVFTVVRNPFGRLVSAFYRVFADPESRRRFVARHDLTAPPASLAEFVDLLLYRRRLRNVHWEPQAHLLGPPGDLLRFETLQEDFSRMCETLGKTPGELPRCMPPGISRVSRSSRPADYYDEPTADLVRHLYAADFERFGYSTALPETV